jgi:hypothetical protein
MMWLGITILSVVVSAIPAALLWWGTRVIERDFRQDERGPHDH